MSSQILAHYKEKASGKGDMLTLLEADPSVALINVQTDLTQELYQMISDGVRNARGNSKVKTICLNINSLGGDTKGAAECAQVLRDAAKSDTRLVSYISGNAHGVAYLLACQTEEITMSSTAVIGIQNKNGSELGADLLTEFVCSGRFSLADLTAIGADSFTCRPALKTGMIDKRCGNEETYAKDLISQGAKEKPHSEPTLSASMPRGVLHQAAAPSPLSATKNSAFKRVEQTTTTQINITGKQHLAKTLNRLGLDEEKLIHAAKT